MKESKAILAALGVAYACFLLWQLPAHEAATLLGPQGGDLLQARALEGSWQHGVARDCTLWGLPVRAIEWRFRPLALLTGRLAVTLRVSNDASRLALTASRGPNTVVFDELIGRVALAEFTPLLEAVGLQLEGSLDVQLTGVVLREGRITAAQGALVWNEAGLVAPSRRTPLGRLVALVTTTKDGVKVSVNDEGGPLRTAGEFLLTADGGYTLTATVAAREAGGTEGLARLVSLGRQGEDGVVRFTGSGQLPLLLP